LESLELSDQIQIITTSEAFGKEKPDPDIFWHTIERLRASRDHPSRCCHVGDDLEKDIKASLSLGFHSRLLLHANQPFHPTFSQPEDLHLLSSPFFRSISSLSSLLSDPFFLPETEKETI